MKTVKDLKKGDKCWLLHFDGTIEVCTYLTKTYQYHEVYMVTFERREREGVRRLYHTRLPGFLDTTKFNHTNNSILFLNREDLFHTINEKIKNLRISKIEALGCSI